MAILVDVSLPLLECFVLAVCEDVHKVGRVVAALFVYVGFGETSKSKLKLYPLRTRDELDFSFPSYQFSREEFGGGVIRSVHNVFCINESNQLEVRA